MIQTRTRKILRDLWSRKVRTLLVVISIFIGVFGTVTLFSMGDLLVRQLNNDLDTDKIAMIRVSLAPNPGVEVDNAALLTTLRSQPDVTLVEGQAVSPLTWKQEGDDDFESSTLFAYSEPFDSIQLEPMQLEDGAYPEAGQHEIAVERRFADEYDLQIGDSLILQVIGNAETASVSEESWTIVGTVYFPYGYPGLNDVLPEDSVFATFQDAQRISGSAGFSSIYARYGDFATAERQADALEAVVASEGSYVPVLTVREDPAEHSRIAFARTIGNVMAGLGLLALLVSGFLVFNVVASIVTEQKQQIGVMKSLGASWLDVLRIYAGIALVYGLLGSIPGAILGIPMGYLAAQGLATSSNTIIDEFGFSLRAIVLGILMGLLIPVLASIVPVWNATRVRIIDAITDLGISSGYGRGFLARLVGALPVPITMRQGISNVVRKKGRMALTALALIVAAGAFMGVFAALSSINSILDDIFGIYHYQFQVMPHDASNVPAVEALIRSEFDDLTLRGPSVNVAIEIEGFDKVYDPATGPPALFANGYDPENQAFALDLAEGQDLSEMPDGVVLSRAVADGVGKSVGDTITIHAGGRSGEFVIAGIATYPFDNVWFEWHRLAALAGFTNANGEPVPTGLLVQMESDDATADEVSDQIDDLNEVLLENGITASYGNITLLNEQISQLLLVFRIIFNFAALLIALVGALGLLNTLSMSVFERQKEIGVMRSIGAGSGTIISQFLSEGVVVGLLAWLVGIPLSYGVYTGMLQAMGLGDEFKSGYSLIAIVFGLVGMLLITTVASLWPSIVAGRKTVSDILRYQ